MSKETTQNLLEVIGQHVTADNIQKYILGTKKSGQPRAIYDVLRDFTFKKKKKGKKIKRNDVLYTSLYGHKKKKNKKNKKSKYWHI